jgi:hypothetical protein
MQKDNTAVKNKRTDILRFFNNSLISEIVFMIICCIAGVFCKKMINPYANMITDALHVPGGISTAVSLMFLVIASGVSSRKWSATIMGIMQASAAMAIGMVGSMGLLFPLAYIIPGVVIDLVMMIPFKNRISLRIKALAANIFGSISAALFADIVVFHLPLKALVVYLCLAALSGAICGLFAGLLICPLTKIKRGTDEDER